MQILHLTDAAARHIEKMIQQKNGKAFRLSVKKSGCSGYRYHPEIIDEINDQDVKIPMSHELFICVDPNCVPMIQGTTIDYVCKNLGQYQLQFKNPNVDGECGCGESFNWSEENRG